MLICWLKYGLYERAPVVLKEEPLMSKKSIDLSLEMDVKSYIRVYLVQGRNEVSKSFRTTIPKDNDVVNITFP